LFLVASVALKLLIWADGCKIYPETWYIAKTKTIFQLSLKLGSH